MSITSAAAARRAATLRGGVEAGYSELHKLDHVDGGWPADQLARLQARYHEVQLVFADSRRYAEDWTYRYLRPRSPTPAGADA